MYVQQPPSYEVEGKENKVYRLQKTLDGLKQAPRAWYRKIDIYMIKNGFCRSNIQSTLYTKVNEHGQILIIFLYVDDMIYIGDFELDEFKTTMMKVFGMKYFGVMKYFLDREVE